MPTFSPATLTELTRSLFLAAGVPASEADTVAASLVDANLCGHDSHGVMRVPQYIDLIRKGTFKPGAPLAVLN
ncbi:MAG TPA: Ldh family oxidoreductase, partial [Gemmata sp.]|nr:Ldh family oxidoreductase [Gemmata sp.]